MTGSILKLGRGFALPLDLVTEATAIVATRGAGKSSASAVVVEETFSMNVQSVIFDRTGVYWGLRSNAKGDGPGLAIYVLGGPHGDVPLEPHAGSMIADLAVDSGHSFVLDLSDFSKTAAVKFAADFLERLYDRKARSRSTTLLVMDEAHFYAPQTPRGGFKGDSARLMGAMEDVVGLGRSRGLGVVLTTQRTQALNKAVLDLIETLFVMRMLSPRARQAVREWIQEKHEDDEKGVIASLDSLPTGTAWVWSPLRGVLEKVALRRIKTFDSYATPKPGEVRVEPSARKELDLTKLGEQMQATAERAKENDPSELRKLVSTLRRQLAQQSVSEPERIEVPVETVVQVPVFSDEDRAVLTQATARVEAITGEVTQLASVLEAISVKAAGATVDQKPAPRRAAETRGKLSASVPRRESHAAVNGSNGNGSSEAAGDVTAPQQKILDALGWYEALGVMTPTRVQVAMIAGYSHSSGGYANLLGQLRSAGLIDYPASGSVALTAEGRTHATDPGLPTTNEGVQAEILRRLPNPQANILRVLIDVYDDALTREEIAERTGYSATSGGFANLLGKLRTGALIDYPTKGMVIAADVLFPM